MSDKSLHRKLDALEYENAIPGFTIEVRSERSTETGDLLFRYFINNRPGVAYTTLAIAIRQGVKRMCVNAGVDLKTDISILSLAEIETFLQFISDYLKKPARTAEFTCDEFCHGANDQRCSHGHYASECSRLMLSIQQNSDK